MIPEFSTSVAFAGGVLAQLAETLPGRQDTVFDKVVGSGPVVRAVLLILLAFSVCCWSIALAKSVEIRRARRQSERFIDIFWDAKNLPTIQPAILDLNETPVAQAFGSGYQELQSLTKGNRHHPGVPYDT